MWCFKRIYGWRLISNTRSCLVPIYVASVVGRNKKSIILPLPALLHPQWQLFCQETINFLVSCEEKERKQWYSYSPFFQHIIQKNWLLYLCQLGKYRRQLDVFVAVFRIDLESKASIFLINYWFTSNVLVWQELKYYVAKLKNFYVKRCKVFLVYILFFSEDPCFLYSPYWHILTFDVYTVQSSVCWHRTYI